MPQLVHRGGAGQQLGHDLPDPPGRQFATVARAAPIFSAGCCWLNPAADRAIISRIGRSITGTRPVSYAVVMCATLVKLLVGGKMCDPIGN